MASEKQVSANRCNAIKSTGPKTNDGKLQSRRNAMRHGLTAATVVTTIEDVEEFARFAAAIRADYQPFQRSSTSWSQGLLHCCGGSGAPP